MDFEGALRARLTAAAPVTALVAQRIYWVDRPQASLLPAIVLQTITEDRGQHMQGFDGLSRQDVQFDIWAASFAAKLPIKEAVIAAIVSEATSDGIKFSRALNYSTIPNPGERVETQFIHRASFQFSFHYSAI